MPRIALPEAASVHCTVDDFLWPWDDSTPVLMMHGFARNATFWNRWVPAIAENTSGLPPRPARLRPLGSTAGRLSLHARDNRRADSGGTRRLVVGAGSLSGRILRRDHRSAARRRIPTASPAWYCAIRRRAFPIRSSAPTRWIGPPPRTRCAPMGSANGAARPSATGSTWSGRVTRCARGSSARWTELGQKSPPRCTIVLRASTDHLDQVTAAPSKNE